MHEYESRFKQLKAALQAKQQASDDRMEKALKLQRMAEQEAKDARIALDLA